MRICLRAHAEVDSGDETAGRFSGDSLDVLAAAYEERMGKKRLENGEREEKIEIIYGEIMKIKIIRVDSSFQDGHFLAWLILILEP
ncbi:hypothetical protein QYF36_013706 [Acer negundo]|nr:hypothetical protein QYF36_013706 [Acer negundo]